MTKKSEKYLSLLVLILSFSLIRIGLFHEIELGLYDVMIAVPFLVAFFISKYYFHDNNDKKDI